MRQQIGNSLHRSAAFFSDWFWKAVAVICVSCLQHGGPSFLHAETAALVAARVQAAVDAGNKPDWWKADVPVEIQANVENKGKRLAELLDLESVELTDKAQTLIAEHFARVWAWHQVIDEDLDAAWAAWDAARDNSNGKQKDELKALAIMTEQIDPIYAEFTPQIRGFLTAMRGAVGEDKTIRLMDIITRSPGAERTYNAYLGMVPEMSDDEKAILWSRMSQAREDALAAWTDGRIIKIFKKYKIRNEFSIDYFGYNYRERYSAWARGQR